MTLSRASGALTALCAAALTAHAGTSGTITQTVGYDFGFDGDAFLTVDGFDDLGGLRTLDRVTFDWDLNYELNYRLENTGPTAVDAGDYAINYEYNSLHQLGLATDDDPPFYGSGGIFVTIQQTLAANDNAPGGADEFRGSYTESYTRTIEIDPAAQPSAFGFFDQAGTRTTVLGGFGGIGFFWINEPVGWDPPSGLFGEPLYPTDDALWIFTESSRHFGSWSVTYHFTNVPAPATAALGVMAAGFASRRRR